VGATSAPHKVKSEIPFLNSHDFITCMVPSIKYLCLYAFTQLGFILIFDIPTGKCLFNAQVSKTAIFLAVPDVESGGVLTVNQEGQITCFNIDKKNFFNYITGIIEDMELGEDFVKLGFFGGNKALQKIFDLLLRQGNFIDAAKFAAKCPTLRNGQTIAAFKKVSFQFNQSAPDLQYYQLLLEQGSLNKLESVELCRRILQCQPDTYKKTIEQLLKEDKLEKSEELVGVLAPFDINFASINQNLLSSADI
ncbi:clathrin heavy chain 1, partial [Reticulomyxa filosa]